MKNQKLKLEQLKVQSFVTKFTKEQHQTKEINGGLICGSHHVCPTKDPMKDPNC